MPLLIVSGLPSSGKTLRAHQIYHDFQRRIEAAKEVSSASRNANLQLVLLNDELLNLTKSSYVDAKSEKAVRAAEYSAIERALGHDTIVIADFLNYIKGYRYQLFCEAKALSTPHCVVSDILHLT